MNKNEFDLPDEMFVHYDEGREHKRLFNSAGKLELIRTQELISRYLPLAPKNLVLDIGGGPGVYSNWLLSLGYKVHLVDPVELHVDQAMHIFEQNGKPGNYSASVGDARHLEFEDNSFDAVLLMGPLYHLTEYNDRLKCLKEAYRILKPNGIMFATAISKFASALDGLYNNMFEDPEFFEIVTNDLRDGQHRNPNNKPHYFTTAFFHRPEQLKEEIKEADFAMEGLFSIEGPAWILNNLDKYWKNPVQEDYLMKILRKLEREESILGMSAHLMGIAYKR